MLINGLKNILSNKYFLFILIFYIIFSGLLLNTDLPVFDEEPYYFLLSKSIFSGEGYNNIFYPHNPPNVEYPPFYPLLISLVLMFFPQGILELRIISVLFGVGSLVVMWFLFFNNLQTTYNNKSQKPILNYYWILLFFIGTNPFFLSYSVRIIAEKCYLFFSLITIFLLEKYISKSNSNKLYFWMGGATLILAFYTKTLGLSLVMAILLYFFIKKRYKDFFLMSGLFIFFVSPWIIRNILVSGVPSEYLSSIVSGYKIYSVNILKLILWNMVQYGQSIKYILFPGCFLSKLIWYFPDMFSLINKGEYFNFPFPGLCSVFLGGVLLFGFYFNTRKNPSLMTSYMLFFFLMLLLCPPDFILNDGNKYLYQMLPFLAYYFVSGLFFINQEVKFLSVGIKRTIICLVGLILIMPNLICDFHLIKGNINRLLNCKNLPMEEKVDYYASWFNVYFMAAAWIKEKVPSDTCIMHNVPYTFYLYSRHKTISLYLDKNAIKNNLQDIRDGNAGYIAVGTPMEEKVVEELNKVSENYIFMPLISFIRVVGKNKLGGFSKICKIISVKPRIKLLYQEGSYFYSNKNYKQAILKFKEALQISPDLAGYYNLGIIYEKIGMITEAIKMYKSALKKEPNFQIVENRLNVLCQREFVKQNTHNLAGYKKLGDYYFKNHDYLEAMDAYTKCLEINDKLKLMDNDKKTMDISSVYYNLGKTYFTQGNYEKAVEEFKKSLRINPELKYKVKHYMKLINRLKS